MKRIKITANELDQAQDFLNDIDYTIEDVPMLLASYGRKVKIEKFPALLNLSDEISNLADKIQGIRYCDYVSVSLREYNELRDFKRRTLDKLKDNGNSKKYRLRLYVLIFVFAFLISVYINLLLCKL